MYAAWLIARASVHGIVGTAKTRGPILISIMAIFFYLPNFYYERDSLLMQQALRTIHLYSTRVG